MILTKRKAQLQQEYIVIMVSFVLIGFVFLVMNSIMGLINTQYENTPVNLSYDFPQAFVQSFLNMPLNATDKKVFSNYPNVSSVKDLFWVDTSQSRKLIMQYRKKFLDSMTQTLSNSNTNPVKLFEDFSSISISSKSPLLFFVDGIPKQNFEKGYFQQDSSTTYSTPASKNPYGNAFYAILTRSGKYSIIYFKVPKNDQ